MKTSNLSAAKKYRDGQDRTSAIDPVEGLHEGLVFSHRFMPPEDAEATQQLVQGSKSPREGYRMICKVLAGKTVSWSEDMEVSFDAWRIMPYKITLQAYRMVLGLQASDPLPGEMVDADSADEEERLDAILNGNRPTEGAAKN